MCQLRRIPWSHIGLSPIPGNTRSAEEGKEAEGQTDRCGAKTQTAPTAKPNDIECSTALHTSTYCTYTHHLDLYSSAIACIRNNSQDDHSFRRPFTTLRRNRR